jgi:hypothetical protein
VSSERKFFFQRKDFVFDLLYLFRHESDFSLSGTLLSAYKKIAFRVNTILLVFSVEKNTYFLFSAVLLAKAPKKFLNSWGAVEALWKSGKERNEKYKKVPGFASRQAEKSSFFWKMKKTNKKHKNS